MSFFNHTGKPSAIQPNVPVIRKVIRPAAPAPKPATQPTVRPTTTTRPPPSSRLQTPTSSPARRKQQPHPDRPSALRKPHKRKSATPDNLFGSDSEGESGDEIGVERPRKRMRSGTASPELGRKRRIRDVRNWDESASAPFKFVHSVDLVGGAQAAKYAPAFAVGPEGVLEVSLRYPGSSQMER